MARASLYRTATLCRLSPSQVHYRGLARYRSAPAAAAVRGDGAAAAALEALLARAASVFGVGVTSEDDVMLAVTSAWEEADEPDVEKKAEVGGGDTGDSGSRGDQGADVADCYACDASDVDSEGFLIEAHEGLGGDADSAVGGVPLMNLHHDWNGGEGERRYATLMVYLCDVEDGCGGETLWPCVDALDEGGDAGKGEDAARAALAALHASGSRYARSRPSPGQSTLPKLEADAIEHCIARYYDLLYGTPAEAHRQVEAPTPPSADADVPAAPSPGVWLGGNGGDAPSGALLAARRGRGVFFEHMGGEQCWHAPCVSTAGDKVTLTIFKSA